MHYLRLLQRGLTLSSVPAGLALVLTLSACGEHKPPPMAAPKVSGETVAFSADSPQLKGLVSALVEPVSEETLRVSGRVVWDETHTVRVFAPLDGRVMKLVAQAGDKVKAGAVLAILSSPAFGEAQADVSKATADVAVAEKALARSQSLNQAGITADKDLQRAQADFDRAVAEQKRTSARSQSYGGGSSIDQQMSLRTPISGVVVERNANPGQEVRADQSQADHALFVVSNPVHLWVNLDLPEVALSSVKTGMSLSLRIAAIGDDEIPAKIEHVADFIDPVSRTTRARASIGNSERRLKAEMFATAEIPVARAPFLRVPATAVILLGQQQYAFIDEGNGSYRRVAVNADEAGFGRMRIKDGIPNGSRIVTDGALLLQQILSTAK